MYGLPLVILGLALSVQCEYVDFHAISTQYDRPFFEVTKFGFEEHGLISINVSSKPLDKGTNSSKIMLFICQEQKYELLSQVVVLSEECGHLQSYRRCFYSATIPSDGNFSLVREVTDASTYHFFIANCERHKLSISVQGVLLNPGAVHLDKGSLPLLVLYPVLASVWGLLALLHIANTAHFWQYKINLHRFFIAVVTLKTMLQLTSYMRWRELASSGMPESLLSISWPYHLGETIWQGVFFCFILLLSKGWCITRPPQHTSKTNSASFSFSALSSVLLSQNVPTTVVGTGLTFGERRSITVMIILIVITHLLFKFYSEFFGYAFIVMFVASVKYAFSAIAHNVQSLDAQLELIEEHESQQQLHSLVAPNNAPDDNGNNNTNSPQATQVGAPSTSTSTMPRINTQPIKQKLNTFKRLQAIIIGYLFIRILEVIVVKFFLENDLWAQVTFEEGLDLLVLGIGIGYTLRLRNFEAQENQSNARTDSTSLSNETDNGVLLSTGEIVDTQQPWEEVFAHKTLESTTTNYSKRRKMPPLIVLENPPTCARKRTTQTKASTACNDKYEYPYRLVPCVQFGTLATFNIFSSGAPKNKSD